jgi:hypothetical protein
MSSSSHPKDPDADGGAAVYADGEVVIPHDPTRGPVTAVKSMLVQFSVAQVKYYGYFERYAQFIAPGLPEDLLSRLASSWLPVELVMAHYEACDKLGLSANEVARLATRVGEHLQERSYVSAAKKGRPRDFDLWTEIPVLHRMWDRLYQGGSVQVVKMGPKHQILELRGFPMNRVAYYRHAQIAVVGAAYRGLGCRLSRLEAVSSSAARDELVLRVAWD